MLKNQLFRTPNKHMVGLRGEYRFVVSDAATGQVKRETDWMPNLITDVGLNLLGSGTWYGKCHIGTGSTPPSVGDTGLAVPSATTVSIQQTINANTGAPDYISSSTLRYRFSAGTLNGNYTEVGISRDPTGPGLWSRALIVDGGGNPTSITVTSTEVLDVYYKLNVVPSLVDSNYTVDIGGVTYNVIRRAAYVSNANIWKPAVSSWLPVSVQSATHFSVFSGTLGPVTGQPSGTTAGVSSKTLVYEPYSNNSFYRDATVPVGLDDCNVAGGFKTLLTYDSVGSWQHQFDVVVPKDNTKVMNMKFRLSWGRI